MNKAVMVLCFLMGPVAFASGQQEHEVESGEIFERNERFICTVTAEEAAVIEELVTTMGTTNAFSLAFKKKHLKNLAVRLRSVSSTQFLGYVFERPHLVRCMKNISESSLKWNALTRSIVRGLQKEVLNNLLNDIPKFAVHTGGNEQMLGYFARQEDWNGFILHLVQVH